MSFISYKAVQEAFVLKESVKKVNKFLYELLVKYNCYIAGGAIVSIFTGAKINDFDIYFPSYYDENVDMIKNDLEKFREELELIKSCKQEFITDFATTYTIGKAQIQLISIYQDKFFIEDILRQFDYFCCMGAFKFSDENIFVLSDRFLHHNAKKQLVFNIVTEFPFASFIRMKKYINRGYDISGLDMLKIILACNKIKIETYADIRKHILGIDTIILKDLTDKMLSNEEFSNKKFEFDEMFEMIALYTEKYFNDEWVKCEED